jgi:hypothetical protein
VIAVVHAALLAIPFAHNTGIPHYDPLPPQDTSTTGGAPSTLIILLGVVLTLATLAALIYLKQRMAEPDGDDDQFE